MAACGLDCLGVTQAGPRLRVARNDWQGTVVVTVLAGAGQCRLAGRWEALPIGDWYQVPPMADYGYRSAGTPWDVAWLVWVGATGPQPGLPEPRRFRADTNLIHHLFAALGQAVSEGDRDLAGALVPLLDRRVRQACGEHPGGLAPLWREVSAHPGRPWNLSALARLAGSSPERLRLASLAQTGRSPMRQVAMLRMRHAAGLLAGGMTVGEAGLAVGYEDASAFTTAFSRVYGFPPHRMRPKS